MKPPKQQLITKLAAVKAAMAFRDTLAQERGRRVHVSPRTLEVEPRGERGRLTLDDAHDIMTALLNKTPLKTVAEKYGVGVRAIHDICAPIPWYKAPRPGDGTLSLASRRPNTCGHGVGPCIVKACYEARFLTLYGAKPAHILK